MIFELFRLSLLERPADLLDLMETNGFRPTRERWLRDVFSREITFLHRRMQFHYVPDTESERATLPLVAGRIGRKRKSKENEPPEAGLKDTVRSVWHASHIVIDPSSHSDGQKVALQRDPEIARCLALMTSLMAHINRKAAAPYLIEVQAIAEPNTFRRFVAEHPKITSITFEMIAPNMFGIHDDWDQDSRELKAKENADKIKLGLESKDGLKTDTPLIDKGVSIAERGTGRVRAKSSDGATFNSDEEIRTVQIPDDEQISWNELFKRLARRVFNL